jgi:pimeloyl-[acyl-carrier protein] methyl ester esterase
MSKLYSEIYGQGKTIVMLHGWGMHSGVWRNFAQELANRYKVICIDLPGHGRSPVKEGFVLPEIAAQVVRIIDAEPVYWLGWSLGGLVALEIAQRYPELTTALIMLASSPCFIKKSVWPGIEPKILESFWESLVKNPDATLLRFLSIQLFQMPESSLLLKQLKLSVKECPAPSAEILTDGLEMLKQQDLRIEFATLKCPILSLLGALDSLVPVKIAPCLQALNSNLQVKIIEHSGHVPFLSHPEMSLQALHAFLSPLDT